MNLKDLNLYEFTVSVRASNPEQAAAYASEKIKAFLPIQSKLMEKVTAIKSESNILESFVDEICGYESDTFSASGSVITRQEAEQVTEGIIAYWIENRLDGVIIADNLESVREVSND